MAVAVAAVPEVMVAPEVMAEVLRLLCIFIKQIC